MAAQVPKRNFFLSIIIKINYYLQANIQKRDSKLRNNQWLTGVEVSEPTYFKNYSSNLDSVVNSNKIGFILTVSITTVILVSVAAGLIIAGLIYWIFKSDANESKKDYEYSTDFLGLLKKLAPEESALAEKEVQNAYDEGYKFGKKEGGSLTTMLKAGAVFMGLFMLNNFTKGIQNNGLAKS